MKPGGSRGGRAVGANHHSAIETRDDGTCRTVAPGISRLAALCLKIHDRVAGTFLVFATFGKKAIHVVAVGGGERIFDASDFLEHHIARRFGGLNVSRLTHRRFPVILPVCKSPAG